MTRDESIVVIKTFIDNPLFSNEHKQAFYIAIHDIERMEQWNMNELILVKKDREADIAMDFITLSEKLQHEIEEQDETINCLQDENKKLHRNINDLQSDLVGATNDYKQTVNEVKILNKQIDMLQRNVGYLCEENRRLRETINAYEQLF